MIDLATLAEAKLRLRIDGDDEDEDLALMITAASGAVLAYLKRPDFVDDTGSVVIARIPAVVKAAALLLVGYLYRNRDENPGGEFQLGELPHYVTALIYQLRDPALA